MESADSFPPEILHDISLVDSQKSPLAVGVQALEPTIPPNDCDCSANSQNQVPTEITVANCENSPSNICEGYMTPFEAFAVLDHQLPADTGVVSTVNATSETLSARDSDPPDNTELSHVCPEAPCEMDAETIVKDEMTESQSPHPVITPDWLGSTPKMVAHSMRDYFSSSSVLPSENYLRGCLWSPDGSCILTNSRDNILRLFNLPDAILSGLDASYEFPEEMCSVLKMRESELIYDYAWYPLMNSQDPATCCFASTTRRNPIRLWDAFSGAVRATYRPINHLGEMISPYSMAFSSDGLRLYVGFNRFIHVFDVSRPGTDSVRRPKLGKKPFQGGMISTIAVPRDGTRQIYATGSYNGSVAMFAEPGNLIGRVQACPSGVTQVLFSARIAKESGAPWYLVAGGRMDSRIFLWDARSLSNPLLVLHRRVENHQRFQFDIDPSGQYLFTGNQTGVVCVYDLAECKTNYNSGITARPSLYWRAHTDSAHGLSVNPALPLIATTSGQRRIPPPRCLVRNSAANSQGSSDELSNSEDDCGNLTDDEACVIPDQSLSSTELPLSGRLTQLPRENRLALWLFPTKHTETN